jgi:hypothetical protein
MAIGSKRLQERSSLTRETASLQLALSGIHMQVMATLILEECLVCLDCSEFHIHGSNQLAHMGAVLLLCTETTKNRHGLLCERTDTVRITSIIVKYSVRTAQWTHSASVIQMLYREIMAVLRSTQNT